MIVRQPFSSLLCKELRRAHLGDFFDVPVVGAVAAVHHIQVAHHVLDRAVLAAEFYRVAIIQFW